MGLLYQLACLIGWHNPWDAGEGEWVCLECGRSIAPPDQVAAASEEPDCLPNPTVHQSRPV